MGAAKWTEPPRRTPIEMALTPINTDTISAQELLKETLIEVVRCAAAVIEATYVITIITAPITRQRFAWLVRKENDLPARNNNAQGITARPHGIKVIVAEPSFGGTPLSVSQPQVIEST